MPIYARKLDKKEIVLKKAQKTNWGRFLDNHYNPDLHHKPFGVSMRGPDKHYKYSQSGLSHNYKTIRILEKLTVEEQNKRQAEIRKFKEVDSIKEGEIYVFIEYCSNSEKTQVSTRHIEAKYTSFAKRFRQGILEKYPFIKVYLKSHSEDSKITKYTLTSEAEANKIENQRTTVRIGAFEISLARVVGRITRTELLFSKIKSRVWPSLPIMLQKISEYLPKTNLMVHLFDAHDSSNSNNIQGLDVTIRLSFKQTKAFEDLREDIDKLHSSKLNDAIRQREQLVKKREEETIKRYGKIHQRNARNSNERLSCRSVPRPMSAQTRFSASFHHSLISMVKQNNEFRQTHGVRMLSAVSGKTMRPQTAATHQSTHSRFRTLDQRTMKNSQSVTTLPSSNKRRKKVTKVNDIEFTAQADENQNVVFSNIPKAVYTVEVKETPYFQRSSREVSLFEEVTKDNTVTIYCGVERQQTSCTTFHFPKTAMNSPDYDDDADEPQYFDELEVKALLLFKSEEQNDDSSEMSDGEETDYEEEFIYDKHTKGFRCALVPGTYMLVVKGEEVKEYTNIFEIGRGDVDMDIMLDPPMKLSKAVF